MLDSHFGYCCKEYHCHSWIWNLNISFLSLCQYVSQRDRESIWGTLQPRYCCPYANVTAKKNMSARPANLVDKDVDVQRLVIVQIYWARALQR